MVYSFIFIVLAAICNAVMDTITHHWYSSIFYKSASIENTKWINFWNSELSWQYATYIPFTKYKIDAWHIFKSLMICFLMLAVLIAWISEPPFINTWWFYLSFYVFLGILWNGTFNIFYNHLLIKNK